MQAATAQATLAVDPPPAGMVEQLEGAQAALQRRPRRSIRLRLVVSLGLCLALCSAFALGWLRLLAQIDTKVHLLHAVEQLDRSVLKMRLLAERHSLAATDLDSIEHDLGEAQRLMPGDSQAASETGRKILARLAIEAEGYRASLARQGQVQARAEDRARASARPGDPASSSDAILSLSAAALEANGLLARMRKTESASLERALARARTGPRLLLPVLLVFFAVITQAFTKALVDPIHRFQRYTARIAAGDYSLIRPARRYRDEFTDLAMAVNHMLAEVQEQQRALVEGAKLAAVGTLVSGIAHELANPLNNVSITTEALMEDLKSLSEEEKWRYLQDIYFETERASEIVKSLLDFTRREKPELVPLDLAELVQSTLRLVQNEINLGNVRLEASLPDGLPRIRGAANQLRQVFLNVLLNAIQAMPAGGALSVRVRTDDPALACVEFQDTGPGIPPEVLPRIFEPFFTTKQPGKGTGLGLSVSLGIVRKLGGDMRIESELGKGTTVHVCVPWAHPE